MDILMMEQGTPEWLEARLGKVTASCFKKAIAKGETSKTYMMQLIAEHMTQQPQESYQSKAMQRGNELEPTARMRYAFLMDTEVKQVGLCVLNEFIAASPDGLIGEDGLLEIKCPETHTHLKYIMKNKLPAEHKAQVQGQLWVTGRQWCDFVSFDDRVHGHNDFFCIRVERDDTYIQTLSEQVYAFVEEMKQHLEQLNKKAA